MEIIDVLDENGNIIGSEDRKKVHDEGMWHIHVGIMLMNKKGEMLLQKRSITKKANPGIWSRTGGHVNSEETPLQGIKRETKEEIGLDINEKDIELIDVYKEEKISKGKEGVYIKNFVYNYFAYIDAKLTDCIIQREEVEEVKFITLEEMEAIFNRKDENYAFIKWPNLEEQMKFFKEKRTAILK